MTLADLARRRLPTLAWTVIALGAALRFAVWLRMAEAPANWLGDARIYLETTRALAHGGWFAEAWIWPPGYPILSLPLALVAGAPAALSIVSLVAGAMIPLLLFLAMRSLGHPVAGVVAAAIAAFEPEAVLASARPLSDAPAVALLVGAVALLAGAVALAASRLASGRVATFALAGFLAAQAVAARTYTVKRLDQYGSLPFDVFASVQDQVYEGISGEEALADDAIRETRGLVVADDTSLLEAYYSSTCGGWRADIATAWPWRASHPALHGGRDGSGGHEWCREARYFSWQERWDGAKLSVIVRAQLPIALDLPRGSVRGELRDIRVTRRDESGRTAEIEYVTDGGSWKVPGDRNRWILRRSDGSILRSTRVTLDVLTSGGRVEEVRATGSGNGHGVGMCQVGAKARARAGQSFREILGAYYPGTDVRPLRGSDVPRGRRASS